MHEVFNSTLSDWMAIAIQKSKIYLFKSFRIVTKGRSRKNLQKKNSRAIFVHILFDDFLSS